MEKRTRWVIGNWKMNGSLATNAALLAAIHSPGDVAARVGVCVPSPYLAQAQEALSGAAIALGAQDISAFASGAYTGQTSAAMLKEFGVRLVLVGHSERRQYQHETNEEVAQKAAAAAAAGITPVICVGESLAEREAGLEKTVIAEQLSVLRPMFAPSTIRPIIAYEPVWAIGTGRTATPEMAQEMHAFIREGIKAFSVEAAHASILYGGSMKATNAKELLAQPDIDGGLIGGASLVGADFLQIVQAAG